MTSQRKRSFARRDGSLLLKVEGLSADAKPHLKIVISKKVARQAVQRNRIRRVLREAVRKELKEKEIKKDFVLIVSPGIDLIEAKEAVHRLFQKTGRT